MAPAPSRGDEDDRTTLVPVPRRTRVAVSRSVRVDQLGDPDAWDTLEEEVESEDLVQGDALDEAADRAESLREEGEMMDEGLRNSMRELLVSLSPEAVEPPKTEAPPKSAERAKTAEPPKSAERAKTAEPPKTAKPAAKPESPLARPRARPPVPVPVSKPAPVSKPVSVSKPASVSKPVPAAEPGPEPGQQASPWLWLELLVVMGVTMAACSAGSVWAVRLLMGEGP